MKRTLRMIAVLLAFFCVAEMFPVLPAAAADWRSGYLEYLMNSVPASSKGFFLADCSCDGIPELYYEASDASMASYLRMAYFSGGSVKTAAQKAYLGKNLDTFQVELLLRKSGGYVWSVRTYSNPSVNIWVFRWVIELKASGGKLSSAEMFREEYWDGTYKKYVKGKAKSETAYDKAWEDYWNQIHDNFYRYNPASAQKATLATVYPSHCATYLAMMNQEFPVTSVALSKNALTLKPGKSYTLKASVKPAYTPDKTITWSTNDASVATVNAGVVRAVKPGKAVITATVKGNISTCTVTVPTLAAQKVTIGGGNQVETGKTLQLTASVSPAFASQAVKWTSSKKSVATVSPKGLVEGVKPGTAKITAKASNGKSATITVRVKVALSVDVTGVGVTPATASMEAGKTKQLSATVQPSNATDRTLTWTSDDTSVATVSGTGLVTAKKAGTATITAKAKNNVNGTCKVTVTAAVVPVTGVSVSPATASVEVGKTKQLSATVQPSNATDRTLTWTSNDTSVATVSGTGLVTAKKAGTATITAKAKNNVNGACKVTVTAAVVPVTGVSVSPATASVEVGKTKQLSATVQPSNATDRTLTWTSDDASVATVSGTGLVTAKKAGTATITAKAKNNVNGACKVTVTAAAVPVTGVGVSPTTASVEVGKTKQLSATVQPSNATDRTLTWSSNDTSVATVSGTGLVTAKKAGTATITAKAKNNVNGTCKIYVGTGSKTSIAEGVYNIKNTASGLMLDVSGSGSADHTNVQVFPSHTGNNQRWIVRNGGSGVYTLIPLNATAAALDVSTGVMQSGQNIQIYHQNQTAAQQFCFYKEVNGNYTIRPNTAPNLVIQALGTAAESNVALGSYGVGNLLQQWSLTKLEGASVVDLQIAGATMPTGTLTPGNSFTLRGVVTSNFPIDWVTAGVYTTDGAATAQVKTVYPGGTSCDIKTTLDAYIKFGQLGTGSYVYRVTALSFGVTKTLVESAFDISPPSPHWGLPIRGTANYQINAPYGMRDGKMHNGIDIGPKAGADKLIYPVRDGIVVRTIYDSWGSGWGNHVVIEHVDENGKTWRSRYAHLLQDSIRVTPGQRVTSDTVIGTMGSTGNSSGTHLHLEIYEMPSGAYVDPAPLINAYLLGR